jgi:hypothetical protein
MRTQFSKIALTATFGLAMAFTISCSSDDGDKGGDKKGDGDKKSNLPACMVENENYECFESALLGKAGCPERFRPEGCPTDWKVKCEDKQVSTGTWFYYYDYEKADRYLTASTVYPDRITCIKK